MWAPKELYLDLMKKTLSFLLWPEPPIPIIMFNYSRPPIKRFIVSAVIGSIQYLEIKSKCSGKSNFLATLISDQLTLLLHQHLFRPLILQQKYFA